MCSTWDKIDEWAFAKGGDALDDYPCIQGVSNQLKLKKIGNQNYNSSNVSKAVDWMLNQNSSISKKE